MKRLLLRRTGAAVVLVGLLAGCSSTPDAAEVPASVPAVTSEASVSESTVTSSAVVPSSAVTPTSVEEVLPSETVVATSAPPPWPADFTPEQQVMAQEAIAVLVEAVKVSDRANADPAQSWEAEVRKFMADPLAYQVVTAIQTRAAKQQRSTGQTIAEAAVTGIVGDGKPGTQVSVNLCLDSTNTDLLDVSGESIATELPLGPRIKETATVARYSDVDGGWLVSEITPAFPYASC